VNSFLTRASELGPELAQSTFVDLQPLLSVYHWALSLMSFVVLMSLLKVAIQPGGSVFAVRLTSMCEMARPLCLPSQVFKFLQLNARLYMLWHVMGEAAGDLTGFIAILFLVLFSYAFMGLMAFGYATVVGAMDRLALISPAASPPLPSISITTF
jgi:hypothetical protein